MTESKFDSNKQFIAVVLFLVFIIISITCLIFCDSKTKNNNSNLNKESNNISNSGVPEIEESEPVTVIVSNNNVNSNTTPSNNTISNSNGSVIVSNKVSNNPNTNKNYVPISYFITELSANKIYVGGTAKINVNINPDNATNKEVKFVSKNPSVATVSSNGTVTGISPGVCTITINVTDGGSADIQMQVFARSSSNVTPTISNSQSNSTSKSNNQSNTTSKSNSQSNTTSNTTVPVTGISVTPAAVTVQKGNTTKLTATITPSNATNKTVTWSSSNTGVATVSNGTVTAVGAGTAGSSSTISIS